AFLRQRSYNLEGLAQAKVLLLDKTGTMTEGRPRVTDVRAKDVSGGEVLQCAASLEQFSTHVLAPTIIRASLEAGRRPLPASDVREEHGSGIEGVVGGRTVRVGSYDWVAAASDEQASLWRATAQRDGRSQVFVERAGVIIGSLTMHDPARSGLPETIARLRHLGVRRLALITGDHPRTAHSIARLAGIDVVHAEVKPADKLDIVREERAFGVTVMVGDGINDAPALAGADVGVALAARGASAASQAADVVLVHDRFEALADAMDTAQRSVRLAWQAVGVGMGLSLIGMGAAVAGLLTPAAGAVAQECIDLLAIALALRATRLNHTVPRADKSDSAAQSGASGAHS
ncbi:MAG: HAD family hydrolase, partial [Actinobacteria bacterium]|nr:HAD family hydrolase [Actinomycetota bacterium]